MSLFKSLMVATIFSLFFTACDDLVGKGAASKAPEKTLEAPQTAKSVAQPETPKFDEKADFKLLADWNLSYEQQQSAMQAVFLKKIEASNAKTIEATLQDYQLQADSLLASLAALTIQSPEIQRLRDQQLEILKRSLSLELESARLIVAPEPAKKAAFKAESNQINQLIAEFEQHNNALQQKLFPKAAQPVAQSTVQPNAQ